MEKNDLIKMIEGLSPEEQEQLIRSLVKKNEGGGGGEKKKFRRKNNNKEEANQPQQPRQARSKKEQLNLFEKDPLFNAFKEDGNVDKKLWAGHQPTERREPQRMVNVNCARCGKQSQVSPDLIFRSRDEHGQMDQAAYYCNKCCTGMR